jgi:hypothetical protein
MLHGADTSNTAIASRYRDIPYDALPHPATHPVRMASVATEPARAADFVDYALKKFARVGLLRAADSMMT